MSTHITFIHQRQNKYKEITMNADVTVIIPYYNGSRFIAATVASVLNQSVQPLEIIIINDGSSLEETNILNSFDERITIFHQENTGVSAARNFGIAKSKGQWLAFLDQDDLWEKYKLEKQWKYIVENSDCHAIHTAVKSVKQDLREFEYKKKTLTLEDFLYGHPNPSYLSSTMIRKDSFIQAGLFNPTLPYSQDLECFLRCSRFFKFDYIDEPLTVRICHEANLSGNYIGVWKENIKTRRFYEDEYHDKKRFKSMLYDLHIQYASRSLQKRHWRNFTTILMELKTDGFSKFIFISTLIKRRFKNIDA
jgi:glycosyltransferase involved in cell wall biosynthesis